MKRFTFIVCVLIGLSSCNRQSSNNSKALYNKIITLDINNTISKPDKYPIGINLNYLRDDNANRPGGTKLIQQSLKEMNVGFLRYPGGEKSDYYLWSVPPYKKPDPQVYNRKGFPPYGVDCNYVEFSKGFDLLDFDEFMTYANEVGAEPFIVVGASPFNNYNVISKETYLKAAVEWIRYANIEKGYGIKYWEIGNENWWEPHGDYTWMLEMANDFGTAMKKVDSSIKIGISTSAYGLDTNFAKNLPEIVDFIATSGYNGPILEEYQDSAEHDFLPRVRPIWELIEEYAPNAKDRIEVVVSEFNVFNTVDGRWENTNDLGHGIAIVDQIGQMLETNKVDIAMLWNTRWMGNNTKRVVFALDSLNQILPSGQALAIWGQFYLNKLVSITSNGRLRSYALANEDNSKANLILINKKTESDSISINLSTNKFISAKFYEWSGTGYDDMKPVWKEKLKEKVSGSYLNLKLPAASVTVIELR